MQAKGNTYLNDRQLALHLKEGRKEAFEYIYKTYYSALCHYGEKYVQEEAVSEDIVSQLFFTLYQKREELQLKNVRSYLFQSVRNAALNHVRDCKRAVDIDEEEADRLLSIKGFGIFEFAADGIEQLLLQKAQQALEKSMGHLPPQTREVFRLSRFEYLSQKEIAKELGISVNTVETHISRALKVLRKEMREFLTVLLL